MRLRIHSLSFEVGDDWRIAPPWNDAKLRATHGVYLTHNNSGLELHVRPSNVVGNVAALLEWLRSQQWGEPPFEVVTRRSGAIDIVGGTFRMRGMEPRFDRVREWYVSDGRRGADATLVHTHSTSQDVIAACEQLLDTFALEGSD